MRIKIENTLTVTCDDVDLSEVENIEFYIKQEDLFFTYTPTVTDTHTMLVTIPKADASKIVEGNVYCQFAYELNGKPNASNITKISAKGMLNENGYGD